MKVFIRSLIFTFLILGSIFALSSCGKDEEKEIVKQELAEVSKDTISYDGQTLSWGQVNHATSYEVSYLGQKYSSSSSNYDVTVESDVTFGIRAIVEDSNQYYKSCAKATEKEFIYKGKIVPALNKATRTYSWDAVEGARGYKIKENGSLFQGYKQELSYKLVAQATADGNGLYETFQVKADFAEENAFTVWSNEFRLTVLTEPVNVTYNGRVVTWDNVTSATGYLVKLYSIDADGVETVVKEDTVSSTNYVYNAFGDSDGEGNDESTVVAGSYQVSVTSVSTLENVISSEDARFAFSYVDPISEIAISEGVISWEIIPNADYYVLEVNGEELSNHITTHKYSGFDHDSYQTYTVRVTPRKEDGTLYSGWSSRFVFTSIQAPYLTWTSSGEAYTLDWSKKEDGSEYNYSNTTFEVIVKEYLSGNVVQSFTTSNVYYYGEQLLNAIGATKNVIRTVQVKAIKSTEGQNDCESFLSDPIYFYNLGDPTAYTISTKDVYTGDLYTTLYINDVQIAEEFRDYGFNLLYRAGVNSTGGDFNEASAVKADTVRQIKIPANTQTTGYKVNISFNAESEDNKKMLTNNDGEKCVFVLSSTVVTLECERLATPDVDIQGSTLTWDPINMASSYQIIVKDLNNVQVGDAQFSIGTSFNIANLGLEAGKYDFYVSALGNGNIVFSSLYSNPIRVTQLQTPTGLQVTGSGDSRMITWDAVEECSSYQVTIGTHVYTINDSKQLVIDQSLLSTAGNAVSVIAVGNNVSQTLTSGASEVIVLYKLKTPYNVLISDNSVSWTGVDAFGGKNVGYEIWIGDERISGNDPISETHYDFYNYAPFKESYELINLDVQVRAVLMSEEKTFFASELSNILNVSRLASPKNVKINQYTGEITWENGSIDLNSIIGYEVKISYSTHPDATETYITTQNSLSPVFNERCVGDTVTITVRALGNGVDNVSSNPYNVSVAGQSNMIGCVAVLEKLSTISLDNNPIAYSVDDTNHIVVVIDENKIGDNNAKAYGIKVDGVLNVLYRFNSGKYTLNETTGFYEYTLTKGSTAIYDQVNNTYKYVSRHSDAGIYDIDVKLVGGNYSKDTSKVSDDVVCYVDSDYTNVEKQIIILGSFVESDVAYTNGKLVLLNKDNAVSYKYTYEYISMGSPIADTKHSGTILASNLANTEITLENMPANATGIRVTLQVLGNSSEYIFDSIKVFEMDVIIPNVDLNK